MARWRTRRVAAHSSSRPTPTPFDEPAAWVFPFDADRHGRARALLGPDSAADLHRASTTAGVIAYSSREYEAACRDAGLDPSTWADATVDPLRSLSRLADAEERHLLLGGHHSAGEALALAELAVAHRRRLARRWPRAQRPLLCLSLILLTHRLHAVGRFDDAVATSQESVDIASRLSAHDAGEARPTMVLALDAASATSVAHGRRGDALEDLLHATDLLDSLARDLPAFEQDLRDHLDAVSAAMAEQGQDRGLRVHLAELAPGWQTAWTGVDADEPPRAPCEQDVSAEHAAADRLYEDAVHLATSDGHGPSAAATAGAAVAAYRRLLVEAAPAQRAAVLRHLVRALWRHAIVISELLERPRDAMGPAREAVAAARELLCATDHCEDLDALVAELGIALHDLSGIAAAAGLVDQHDQLSAEVRQLCDGDLGPGAMRALGTALHNRAAEVCETAVALAQRGAAMSASVTAGIHASTRAVAVRRALAVDDEPAKRWELANSLLAYGHLLCLKGDGQNGAQAMADAYDSVAELPGPAADTMRDAACAALQAARASYPDIVADPSWPA